MTRSMTQSTLCWRHDTCSWPAETAARKHRQLPSGALRVRVYAGVDPVTRRRHDLIEIVPAGPGVNDRRFFGTYVLSSEKGTLAV